MSARSTTSAPHDKENTAQNSSVFRYIAIDTIHESATNPRRTFDDAKLCELAESIRANDPIQPIAIRPDSNGFEIAAGARQFRAPQLAVLISLPARIVDSTEAQSLGWALVENFRRVDVHLNQNSSLLSSPTPTALRNYISIDTC